MPNSWIREPLEFEHLSVGGHQLIYRQGKIDAKIIAESCRPMKCAPEQLVDRIDKMLARLESLQAELDRLNAKLVAQGGMEHGT